MEQAKADRAAEEGRLREQGNQGDVDFVRMIRQYRETQAPAEQAHSKPGEMKICICVRKRPINSKEIKKKDHDSVTCINPMVIVHDCKFKVDGISKYLDNANFEFDHTFHEDDSTDDIYYYSVQPLVEFVLNGGRATVFAYGQTGSGKTYTMQGIQTFVSDDLFALVDKYENQAGSNINVYVSFFEIYGGRCQDLLNSRQRLNVREDGNGEVVVSDLLEMQADSAEALQAIIDAGNRNRTTHATESNDESSRSHAICQITLKMPNQNRSVENVLGRFSLIDLAGSERGADTKSHDRQRRMEGAEINKSLLALKECIRALDSNSNHVPYRASKLTLVLKDSFTNKKSRTVMIATVSPAASSADHTINTLRYADRIKEQAVGGQAARNAQKDGPVPVPPPPEAKPTRSPAPIPAAAPLPPKASAAVPSEPKANRFTPPPPSSKATASDAKANNRNEAKVNLNQDFNEDQEDEELIPADEEEVVSAFHRTVQDLFEEEEDLLNLHMSVIQENAELLTEEGRLLQQIQGENNDIDAYAARLDAILKRKQQLIDVLKEKLGHFRRSLIREEKYSKQLASKVPAGGY